MSPQYVLDLMDDDQADQVRFQLPVCIGARYGSLPAGMVAAKTVPSERIKISTDVYMRGAIQSITSPSHPTLSVYESGPSATTTKGKAVSADRGPPMVRLKPGRLWVRANHDAIGLARSFRS